MNYILTYLIYLFFGVLPSLIWLSHYLKKDNEPEPKILLTKIFVLGALITIPTVSVQQFVLAQLKTKYFDSSFIFLITSLFLMAFIEEASKFLVVKFGILKHKEFDEPIDAMIYMITSALGFAAAENFLTLVFVSNDSFSSLNQTTIIWENVFQVSLVRFLGATLLHALCAGVIGFTIGYYFYKQKEKNITLALILATILHSLYNLSIMKLEAGWSMLNPFILLIVLYLLVSSCFQKLKKIKNNE